MSFVTQIKEEFRVETRVNAALHVKVAWAENALNTELLCTYDVSRHGGRIGKPKTPVKAGQLIWVSRKTRKARFKIAWVGVENTHQAEQIGVQCVEPGACIWDDELQKQLQI